MTDDLMQLCQQSRSAEELERGVLEMLQRVVGCDVAFFSVSGEEHAATALGLDESLMGRVVAAWERYGRELTPVKAAAQAARSVAVDTRVLGGERVRQSAYYREVVATVGGRHSLMAYVPWRGQTVAAIMLGRTGSEFSDHAVRRVEELLPALGVARAAFGLPWIAGPLLRASASAPVGWWRRRSGELLEEVTRPGRTLSVRDRDGFREMVATEAGHEVVWTRASLIDSAESGWPYVELLHLAAVLAKRRRRALFIGCGGAVAMRQFARSYPGIQMDVVECEAMVIELSRRWYGLDAVPGVTTHIADGVDFVARARPASWDVAVVDAYDDSELASRFARRPFFADLARVLRPGGAVAINVIGALRGDRRLLELVRAARREFRQIRIVPVLEPAAPFDVDARRNVVVVATARSSS